MQTVNPQPTIRSDAEPSVALASRRHEDGESAGGFRRLLDLVERVGRAPAGRASAPARLQENGSRDGAVAGRQERPRDGIEATSRESGEESSTVRPIADEGVVTAGGRDPTPGRPGAPVAVDPGQHSRPGATGEDEKSADPDETASEANRAPDGEGDRPGVSGAIWPGDPTAETVFEELGSGPHATVDAAVLDELPVAPVESGGLLLVDRGTRAPGSTGGQSEPLPLISSASGDSLPGLWLRGGPLAAGSDAGFTPSSGYLATGLAVAPGQDALLDAIRSEESQGQTLSGSGQSRSAVPDLAPTGGAGRTETLQLTGDREALAGRLGQMILRRLGKNEHEFTIRLNPPRLGHLRLEMRMRGSSLDLSMHVENGAARHLLQSRAGDLQQTLLGVGIDMERFSVEIRDPGGLPAWGFGPGGDGRGPGGRRGQAPGRAAGGDRVDAAATGVEEDASDGPVSVGLIDTRA